MPSVAAHLGLTSSDLLARFGIPRPTGHTAIAAMLRQYSNSERPLQTNPINGDDSFWEVGRFEVVVDGFIVNKYSAASASV